MRILVLSNFYPPHEIGGYEQWCSDLCDCLAHRGHQIRVLTSDYVADESGRAEPEVYRTLKLESNLRYYQPLNFFMGRRRREKENILRLAEALQDFQPDLLFVWGMWNMTRALPQYVERLGSPPIVYWLSDRWPVEPEIDIQYWEGSARHRLLQWPRRALGRLALRTLRSEGKPIQLQFKHVICLSDALRQSLIHSDLPIENAKVIRHGVDSERFAPRKNRRERKPGELDIVYVGGLAPHKGVHTAIEALALLGNGHRTDKLSLTLIGDGHPEYKARLNKLMTSNRLDGQVILRERVPRSKVAELLGSFDCLVFPSLWEEPLGRSHIEGMACGLAVVSTATGGSKEVVKDEVNALTFSPGDSQQLARQLDRIAGDSGLADRLSGAGRQTVLEKFRIDQAVVETEQFLLEVAGNTNARRN